MLFRIPITIDERGNVRKDIMVLGRENENLSKTLSISIPKSISDKWLYIEFENNNKFTSPKLEVDNCKINYDVPQSLMKKGNLKCQVVAKDADNIVWKSNNFEFQIYSSINATEQVIQSSPDVLNDLQKQIDAIELNGVISEYPLLKNKPSINGVELVGNKTTEDLGIVSEETDPTVPSHVKNITEENINKWNSDITENQLKEAIDINKKYIDDTAKSLAGQNEYIGSYQGAEYTAETIQTELSSFVIETTKPSREKRNGDIINIVNGIYSGQQWIYGKNESVWKYYIDFDNHSVIDNLTSDSVVDGLSARQGKLLKDDIDKLNTLIPQIELTQKENGAYKLTVNKG